MMSSMVNETGLSMMWVLKKNYVIGKAGVLVLLVCSATSCTGLKIRMGKASSIRNSERAISKASAQLFVGEPVPADRASVEPLLPSHPFLAAEGVNSMHSDSNASDVQHTAGPLGSNLVHVNKYGYLEQRQMDIAAVKFGNLGGMCPTVTFDTRGNLVTVCVSGLGIRLMVLDPDTLQPLADRRLKRKKQLIRKLRTGAIMSDTSGGAYFVLARGDRPVVPVSGGELKVFRIEYSGTDAANPHLACDESYNVAAHPLLQGLDHVEVTTASPDHDGNLWFTTRRGIIGVIPMAFRHGAVAMPGRCRTIELDRSVPVRQLVGPGHAAASMREAVHNSFVLSEDGVFVVSNRAMYRLNMTRDQKGQAAIVADWSTPYSAVGRKAGMASDGSGTTPTLAGDSDAGIVVIVDNANPRVQLNVMDRSTGALLCDPADMGLFLSNESAVEDSVVAFARKEDPNHYSILVNNSYGVAAPNMIVHASQPDPEEEAQLSSVLPRIQALVRERASQRSYADPSSSAARGLWGTLFAGTYNGANFARGISRFDVVVDPQTGSVDCQEIWQNGESVGGVMKLSTVNQVVYAYTREFLYSDASEQAWYLTAIDFKTGRVLYRSLVGFGAKFYNIQGAINLHNGAAYIPVARGLVRVRDRTD